MAKKATRFIFNDKQLKRLQSYYPEFARKVEKYDPKHEGRNAQITSWKQEKAKQLLQEPLFADLDPGETQESWQNAIVRFYGNYFHAHIKKDNPMPVERLDSSTSKARSLVLFTEKPLSPKSLERNRKEFPRLLLESMQTMINDGSLGTCVLSFSYAFRDNDNKVVGKRIHAGFDANSSTSIRGEFDEGKETWKEYIERILPRKRLNLSTTIPRNEDGLPLFPVFNLMTKSYAAISKILDDYFLALWEHTQGGSLIIPWDDIVAHPDHYYDTWAHPFPCPLSSPEEMDEIELTQVAMFLSNKPASEPFTFFSKSRVNANIKLAKDLGIDSDSKLTAEARSHASSPPAPRAPTHPTDAASRTPVNQPVSRTQQNASTATARTARQSQLSRTQPMAASTTPARQPTSSTQQTIPLVSQPSSTQRTTVSASLVGQPVSTAPRAPSVGERHQHNVSIALPLNASHHPEEQQPHPMHQISNHLESPNITITLALNTSHHAEQHPPPMRQISSRLEAPQPLQNQPVRYDPSPAPSHSGRTLSSASTGPQTAPAVTGNTVVKPTEKQKRKRERDAKTAPEAVMIDISYTGGARQDSGTCKPPAIGPVLVEDPTLPPVKKVKHSYEYVPYYA